MKPILGSENNNELVCFGMGARIVRRFYSHRKLTEKVEYQVGEALDHLWSCAMQEQISK